MRMRNYMLCYLILWLPAALVSLFFQNSGTLSTVLQWVFAAVFLFGWGINTGLAAYHFPKYTMAFLLFFTGCAILAITLFYHAPGDSFLREFIMDWGGIFSYKPLEVLVLALLGFNIPQEVYVVGFLIALCLIGYIVAMFYRRVSPNPYRPKIVD